MPAGTPTYNDMFNLSQSSVFKGRVTAALVTVCAQISSEAITPIGGVTPMIIHQARKNQVASIMNPSSFQSWLVQFVTMAASNAALIADATVSATNYTPITAANADTVSGGTNIPDSDITNAISAAFNSIIAGL